jgi:hypothetical protein
MLTIDEVPLSQSALLLGHLGFHLSFLSLQFGLMLLFLNLSLL